MRLFTIRLIATLALVILTAPLAAEAQQTETVRRIGYLSAASQRASEVEGFRQGLRDHGYVEGRNLFIEWQFAEGRLTQLKGLAAELVRAQVEVIITVSTSAAIAAKYATTAIPIVFTHVSDPIASGLVPSLARPDGNITGASSFDVDLTGKRLELLKEAIPSLRSVVFLTDPTNPSSPLTLQEAQVAARRLGLEARLVEVRGPAELEPALTMIAHDPASSVLLVPGPVLYTHRIQIVELATKGRLPVMGWHGELAKNGALISYGASSFDMGRRAAAYVDKILKGVKPADLPVEQPIKFELVINLKTAHALGLTIPSTLLFQADEVIQ
jgi:putative tryptophan/tyrosine transport system substrate-binding protein